MNVVQIFLYVIIFYRCANVKRNDKISDIILDMITIKDIQIRLREAIETSSISKKELAERLNVNPSTVSRYLHDDKFPSLETFANLCEILDVSSDEILGLK